MSMKPLSREEIIQVIEGKGNVSRVPVLMHCWVGPGTFQGETRAKVAELLDSYPMDAQIISLKMPEVYTAPADDPNYRWSYRDPRFDLSNAAHDNSGVILDWDEEMDLLLDNFPDPEYPGLIPECEPADGRYRVAHWWNFYFERFWGIRSMDEALMDFYLNPEAVHTLFRKYTDFYIRVITRAKEEMNIDAIYTSDDLGTQHSTFFSPKIFDEFFYPYYKQVIDHIHSLGMHIWLHTCGNIEAFMPRFVELGIDVIHPIQKYTMDEKKIADAYGDKICIWAGFDMQQIIPYGTPEDVRREVRFLMDTYRRPEGRFMLTLGNGATPDMPAASLEALLDEAFTYGQNQ
ncbi:MAG: hypothetical protein E7335_01730 [Clostridiales bacterium]|nr:hypothetical protein [Clostridiales bacterium]